MRDRCARPADLQGAPSQAKLPTYPPCWFTAPASALPEPHGRMPTGILIAFSQSGRWRSPFSTWRARGQVPGFWSLPSGGPRARDKVLLPYLEQQPVPREGHDAIPLTQLQPLYQLPGVVLAF